MPLDFVTPQHLPRAKGEGQPTTWAGTGRKKKDWHKQWAALEPVCSSVQWRQRDRFVIINISDMGNRHLGNCIRFASTKSQHSSRLGAVLAERARRNNP